MSDREPAEATSTAPSARSASAFPSTREFEAFYREFTPKLVGFLIRQGARLTIAAEIAQETMLTAFRKWAEISNPHAWARRVASRALIRHLSRADAELCEEVPEPSALLASPGAAAEWEQQQDLLRLLADLPPRQRQIMAWKYDGHSPAEIAEELGISAETVRASLLKARRVLATRLAQREGGEER
ncbi:sigma-70 family RNA polymerase sigma factor [Streptomyces chartreusis]|uniref:sigma-70 family RNA polymerase sigma factor n=1 Tax=Streptomyces chartreusis TaxID=1969 RepID=UPI0035DD3A3D